MTRPELLAPVGGWPQLHAAVRFGADAVYLGGNAYGLRAFAGNFDEIELPRAIAYAHEHNVLVYVALNAFLYNEDLPGIARAAALAYDAGADAAIVSDPAMVDILRENAPKLPMHISTQANTLNWRTAAFWYRFGAQRIVLARELSLDQITSMRAHLPKELELEAFVHGAMCASYSGRCVLSNHMTGRDSNQGACAQACRWNYALVEEKRPGEYMPIVQDQKSTTIYSANDLCMIDHLEDVYKAGIASFKIEGRMKTDYYVATVVGAYRKAIDAMLQGLPYDDAWKQEAFKASHRESGTGFYYDKPNSPPGEAGYIRGAVFCGIVLEVDDSGEALVEQRNKFSVGEKLTLLTPQTTTDFILQDLHTHDGEAIQSAPHPQQQVRIKLPLGAQVGDFLRRE